MKKMIILLLALAITACGPAPVTEAPTEESVLPTQTPVVLLQTVVVTVIPTNVPTEVPTEVPSATPLPPPTEAPATQPPAATVAATAPPEPSGGLVTMDNALGGGWFTNMMLTESTLALRCQPYKDITFTVTPSDPSIAQVDFYYRIEDRATGAIFDWQGPRRMSGDGRGNFALTFTGEDVNANFRKPNAWFDFQFVGISKSGGKVGNSEKIVQQVSYTFDCP